MIVTYNWLKEFVECDLSTQELGDLLTMLGLEVEGVREVGGGLDQVVVAVVEERRKHPNADKLSLCKVNNGREILDIVCGAQNFTAGDKVALAQIGAVLPGDFKIKRSKIRGEESCGMLCSERELGLSAESEGIMILPPTCRSESPCSMPWASRTPFSRSGSPQTAPIVSVLSGWRGRLRQSSGSGLPIRDTRLSSPANP